MNLSITGDGDAPVITVGNDSGAVGEDATLVATGNLDSTDIDVGDTPTWTVGTASHGTVAINAATGEWTYTLANASTAVQELGENDLLADSFVVTVTDEDGLTDTRTVNLSITGDGDAPVLAAITSPAAVQESVNASAQNIAAINGTLSVSDVDVGDTLAASISGTPTLVWSGGTLTGAQTTALTAALVTGKLSFGGTATSNGGAQSINWTWDAAAANLDFLAAGQTLTVTYGVKVNDGLVDSNTQNLSFTIAGTNDAPVITSSATIGTIREHLINSTFNGFDSKIVGSVAATDADSTGLSYSIVSDSSGGAFKVDAVTGQVSVRDVSLLDYEVDVAPNAVAGVLSVDGGGKYYSLLVQVSDGTTVSQQSAKIYLTNVTNTATGGGIDFVDGVGSTDTFTLNNGNDVAFGDGGADSLTGNNQNDMLFGGFGVDSLTGNNGNDTLYGGAGADTLNGGGDADTFVFGNGWNTGVDAITDFNRSDGDKLSLVNDYAGLFMALSASGLTAGQLLNGTLAAETASTRLIYDASTGALYYDADGLGGTAAVQFATFAPGGRPASLLDTDFVVGPPPGP